MSVSSKNDRPKRVRNTVRNTSETSELAPSETSEYTYRYSDGRTPFRTHGRRGKKMKLIINSKITLTDPPVDLVQNLATHFTVENPAYREAERMGRNTYGIDQWLCFFEQPMDGTITLPRGVARFVHDTAGQHGSVEIIDNRLTLAVIDLEFRGSLRAYQEQAVTGMLHKDFGVLEAGTGSGKTVMALAIIAARQQPTLILVHTKELLHQWRDRIQQFLGTEAGLVGDGRFDVKPVTVAIVNSAKKALHSLVDRFGHLIVANAIECRPACSAKW